MKKRTIRQIRQQTKEKINRMRAACVRLTDDNARDAIYALCNAETFYNKVRSKDTRSQTVLVCYDHFLKEASKFEAILSGGAV